MVTVKDRVRFVETDMMGVVHHANYFRWFEMGRVEYLRRAGILLRELMSEGILFPIRHVECKYLAPAYFDDDIVIEAVLKEVTKVRMVFSYRIIRETDQTVLVTGETQNAFTNSQGQVSRLPQPYYDRLLDLCRGEAVADGGAPA